MTNPPRHSDPSGFRSDDEFDEVFAYGNPNPGRVGCPSREVLIALSRRDRPIGDPGYEHIVNCSPCYREFRTFQRAKTALMRARRRSLVSAAAMVLIAAGGAWVFISRDQNGAPQNETTSGTHRPELHSKVDLRKYSVMRGEQHAEKPPVSLAQSPLRLTVLLPVGSEPGSYEVQLVDAEQRALAHGSGHAEIRDYVTTLEATLDLGAVPAGAYQLAIRRQSEDWRLFPAAVR